MTRPEWLTIANIVVCLVLCVLVLRSRRAMGLYTTRIEQTSAGTRQSNELVRQSNERRNEIDQLTQTDNEMTREAIAEYLRERKTERHAVIGSLGGR